MFWCSIRTNVLMLVCSVNSSMEGISNPELRAGKWKKLFGVLMSTNILLLVALRILVLIVFKSVFDMKLVLDKWVNKEIAFAWIIFLRLRGSSLFKGRYLRDKCKLLIFYIIIDHFVRPWIMALYSEIMF